MKFNLQVWIFIIFLTLSFTNVNSQIKLQLKSNQHIIFLKELKGTYENINLIMGQARGNAIATFGIFDPQDFGFNISILGKRDDQIGLLKSSTIETNDFESFKFLINWENYSKNQGTPIGLIIIDYKLSEKECLVKFDAYSWQMLFKMMLTAQQSKNLTDIITTLMNGNVEYKKYLLRRKKEDSIKNVNEFELNLKRKKADSLFILKIKQNGETHHRP